MTSLATSTELFKLFGDSTRLRLLALLAQEELTVAEIVRVLQAPQSRISTHLGKLREAGLVQDRQNGSSRYTGSIRPRCRPPQPRSGPSSPRG
jgi:ArsR family transcriptional regulator